MESSGLKIEALRRFDEGGFSGIELKTALFARIGGKSRTCAADGFRGADLAE